ncbi:MAG: hypothetical protein Q8L48_31700 [Archangium sp.]|nr:hypothetical protein [Archangium sp.]
MKMGRGVRKTTVLARRSHVLLVTLPEATPIHEAMALERDLARADIKPMAWAVNQCLTVSDPVLLARQANEAQHLPELAQHATRIVREIWHAEGPRP